MSGSLESTLRIQKGPRQCAVCGEFTLASEPVCAHCGTPFEKPPAGGQVPHTDAIARPPSLVPRHDAAPHATFAPDDSLTLQHLPSAACLFLTIDRPVILGRGDPAADENLIDLTDLRALQQGVSRCHCLIQRQGDHLTVRDLHSTNGTYLNALRLSPGEDYPLADGDRLILGMMHLLVIFSGPHP